MQSFDSLYVQSKLHTSLQTFINYRDKSRAVTLQCTYSFLKHRPPVVDLIESVIRCVNAVGDVVNNFLLYFDVSPISLCDI